MLLRLAKRRRALIRLCLSIFHFCSEPVAAGIYEQSYKIQMLSLHENFPNSTLKCSSNQIVAPLCTHYISISGGGFLFTGAPFLKNGELALTIIL
jgi:hypothetical protein